MGGVILLAVGEDEGGIGVFLFVEDGIGDLETGLKDADLAD